MKFTKEDYKSLKEKVENLNVDVKASLQHYYDNGIGEQPAIRLAWDLFWASKWSKENRGNKYLDKHIETAMKKIMKELIQKENKQEIN